MTPRWDSLTGELSYDRVLVKRYKLPAENQRLILSCFEEEGWPRGILDPLPLHPSICSKTRLHDTIKNLNRNQINRLIRFRGDGTGRRVLWEGK